MVHRQFLLAFIILLALGISSLAQTNGVGSGGGIGPNNAESQAVARPRVLFKPEPERPKDIDKNVEASIVLRAVFTREALVAGIKFVKATPASLPKSVVKELTKAAIEAAKKIKFIPAEKDGRAVSMNMLLEYSFAMEEESKEAPPKN